MAEQSTHIYIKHNLYKLEFLETGIEARFYTKVVRNYWFKCHKLDFCHKIGIGRAQIELLGQHPIESTTDSIWALNRCFEKVTFKFIFFLGIQNSDLNLLFLIKHHLEELKEGIVDN